MNGDIDLDKQRILLNALNELPIYEIKSNLHKYSFFSVVRHLEASLNQQIIYNKVGESSSPTQDLIRIYQHPSLSFSFRNIEAIDVMDNTIHLAINEVGLLGTNSPLPGYLIEFIYQRKHQYGDGSWAGFVNMLQQRILTLFYRSWMNAQSIASLEYKNSDQFSRYIGSIVGLAGLDKNQKVGDIDYFSKLYFSGFYFQKTKSKSNFETLLSHYFCLPIKIRENMGCWFKLPKEEQTKISASNRYNLGDGVVVGNKIYDKQTKIRIVIGPMGLKEYESFFDGQANAKRLVEWVRLYLGVEFDWDVQLILKKESVPITLLDSRSQLGFTSFLGKIYRDVDDMTLKYQLT